eukprot:8759900-Pyramimonas_sp.AAC.1
MASASIAAGSVLRRGLSLPIQPQPPCLMLQLARVIVGELLMHSGSLATPIPPHFFGQLNGSPCFVTIGVGSSFLSSRNVHGVGICIDG